MSTFKYWLTLSCLMVLLLSCSHGGRKVVAVSQCSMDEWRDQMNEEMRREAFFHPELDVEYHSTADNSEEQIRDIESFIQRGVDLIIVAPNEEDALRPVIEKAYDAGIPVVLIDRRAHTDKYTAYVGGDNEEVGRQVAQYIVSKLPHGGNVVEIEGLTSSSSSQERKSGFRSVISQHPEIHIVQDVAADWQRQKAVSVFSQLAAQGWTWNNVDVVFAYNDRMAIGAYEAWRASAGAFLIVICVATVRLLAFCKESAVAADIEMSKNDLPAKVQLFFETANNKGNKVCYGWIASQLCCRSFFADT